jgi:hypothetical protein
MGNGKPRENAFAAAVIIEHNNARNTLRPPFPTNLIPTLAGKATVKSNAIGYLTPRTQKTSLPRLTLGSAEEVGRNRAGNGDPWRMGIDGNFERDSTPPNIIEVEGSDGEHVGPHVEPVSQWHGTSGFASHRP